MAEEEGEDMEQQDLVTKISHESIKEMEKHHTSFC
jgi:hypothetical protein